MCWFWLLKWGGMSGYNRLLTSRIFSSQLLTSKAHSTLSLKNKTVEKITVLPEFYLPSWEKCALPYTSHDLAQNLLKWLVFFTLPADVIFTLPYYPCGIASARRAWQPDEISKAMDPSLIQGGNHVTVHIFCLRTSKEAVMKLKSSQTQTWLWKSNILHTDTWSTTLTSIWATKFGTLQRNNCCHVGPELGSWYILQSQPVTPSMRPKSIHERFFFRYMLNFPHKKNEIDITYCIYIYTGMRCWKS